MNDTDKKRLEEMSERTKAARDAWVRFAPSSPAAAAFLAHGLDDADWLISQLKESTERESVACALHQRSEQTRFEQNRDHKELLSRIRELHKRVTWAGTVTCEHCGDGSLAWPCPTISILDGEGDDGASLRSGPAGQEVRQ